MPLLRDLTDDEARAALVLKWGQTEPGTIPAWVAEMDYAVAPPVLDAVRAAVERGELGYPRDDRAGGELGAAYSRWAARHFNQDVDPDHVQVTADVTVGVRIALEVLSERAPFVLPLPAYDPQHGLGAITGLEQWGLPVDPDGDGYALDLDALDALFARGARTLLLTQPHNPGGHVFTRGELEGIRDVVTRHGARVVSDEIHGPLVLPGAEHVPYLSIDGTADHAVAVTAASKAFNVPGLKCAQILTTDAATRDRLLTIPWAQNDSWGSLGVAAALAAYDHGDAWLAELIERLDQQRTLLASLVAEHLPDARMRPLEATYMAWLDLRAYGHDDPAAVIRRGGVRVSPGESYWPGLTGHVRLNIATSPDRLTEIVRRMGAALTDRA
ncbi:aminotransferase class I/II-fold pyridoxal phosphate-dependent enzyme [Nocardioides anomalus]|uniref:cysteine-S-conjugate beta-lyase n=1 Tax=Nocardioides anomalus TaxID=2712223 RepID=A0A6G6WJ71_9ACTN|nr:aminotransferase class I/II-fold pyridoxal phosphate-dependent enzyme [Nocardioides anomalus]QIG45110.1 aminotransferase class I/II-fold pyridoxal phosphate-dependent enzyme [Nocardioides anomalus]